MLFVYPTIEDIDDTEKLHSQNETSNDTLSACRQSSEVNANDNNKNLIIAILLVVLALCVVSLTLLIVAVMQNREVTTSLDQLSKLHENQTHLMICENLHDVCTNDKLNSNDVITKADKVCPVSHNETNNPSQDVSTWFQYLANSSNTQFQATPGILSIRIAIKNNIMYLQTKPFYAFNGEYLVSMGVYSNGCGNGEGTHVSVFLYLIKGSHNIELGQTGQQPTGRFTIELLNQLNDSDHYAINVTFGMKLPCDCISGVEVAERGWGTPYFISHDSLMKSNSYYNYYKDDTLYFRISSYDLPDYQVLPTIIRMHDFTKKKKEKEQWYSRPFFAFDGGYLMCLRVDAAGDSEGEGTHVSVYLYLMKGPYDDELEQSDHWPLRGSFTIELLPYKINDIFHFPYERKVVVFDMYTSDNITNRVINGNRAAKGWGFHKFIPHSMLQNIVTDDSVQFIISYQEKRNWVIYKEAYTWDVEIRGIRGIFSWFFRWISQLILS